MVTPNRTHRTAVPQTKGKRHRHSHIQLGSVALIGSDFFFNIQEIFLVSLSVTSPHPPQVYWYITDIEHVSLRCIMWWFDAQIFLVRLADTSFTSYSCHVVFVIVRKYKINLYSTFQVQDTEVLTVVTMLYIRSSELILLTTGSLCPVTNISSTLWSLATTVLLKDILK